MAHYDYACKDCGASWELNVPIADRDRPLTAPCPNCDGAAIERIPAAPGVSYTTLGVRGRTPESFKDVLRNIKSKHRHSTIDV